MVGLVAGVMDDGRMITDTAARPERLPGAGSDRRRPGRLENPSPELIAMMRRPTPEARRRIEEAIALYDAPHFTVPPEPGSFRLNGGSMLRYAGASVFCAAFWYGALKLMIAVWG